LDAEPWGNVVPQAFLQPLRACCVPAAVAFALGSLVDLFHRGPRPVGVIFVLFAVDNLYAAIKVTLQKRIASLM
jgi:hypothetical protein